MANARRLAELGMVPPLAKEVADQINEAGGGLTVPQAAIPDVSASPTQAQHNAVLAALRAAGIIAP